MKRWPLLIALTVSVAFAAYFSWFDIARHDKTNSTRFDLGNMEQVVWNIDHGRGFTLTDPYGSAQVSRFAFHADVFLIVIAPLYALVPRTETLLVLQALVVASGALAIFFLGRKYLPSDRWAALFSLLYIVNPAIQWATIFDFHPVTLAIAIILWAVLAVANKKYWLTLGLVVLAMTTKEEIGLGLIAIGIYIWRWQRQKKWGMALTFIPLAWSLIMLLIVLPHYADQSTGDVYQTVFGNGTSAVVAAAVTHPLRFAHQLLAHQNLVMAEELLAPFGFLPLGSLWSLGALPDYGINALSLKPSQHLIISHYTSGVLAWLCLGSVVSLGWLLRLMKKKIIKVHDYRTLVLALVLWLVGWSAYSAWAIGPLPGTKNDDSPVVIWRNDYAADIAKWERQIPSAAAVSVTNDVGSHFARRQYFYSFPYGLARADYVIILEHHATPVIATDDQVSGMAAFLRADATHWSVLEYRGDLTVLRRR